MFNGGGVEQPSRSPMDPGVPQLRQQPYVKIIEQPAAKALRFRYECEGRSAGSIPGANSTLEVKSYPTIQVVGFRGKSVVVVSCVTKDSPYKVHPHNLVGREGCKKGVCTLNIPEDTMTVQFTNLGIQCVKKRDIESALRQREEIRVDPFKQGYDHRNQPTSIDLNAVRLCFQVFLETAPGKYTQALKPVVSEPIFDKKAMCELTIVKLSDCVSYVDGGRKDIILLCEKVAKDDIQVRFYEEKNNRVVWEAFAEVQPAQVHKQHAIWFQTPRYHTREVTEPVKVFIQLRRPSDNATSDPLPFELLPLDSGRPPHWPFRRKKPDYEFFNSILANDARITGRRQLVNLPGSKREIETQTDDIVFPESNNNVVDVVPSVTPVLEPMETVEEPSKEILSVTETMLFVNNNNNNSFVSEEKSFNELINQVAELDEIYSETQSRLLNQLGTIEPEKISNIPQNESFDDAKTYSSLQLAFKNPLELEINQKYEDVVLNPPSPIIDVTPQNKRENEIERLPPLPPKRSKKIETYIGGSMSDIQIPENTLNRSSSILKPVSRSQSFNLQRPKSQGDLVPPGKRLPPAPYSTLPSSKKRGFFSKIFGRKSKTPNASRETSVTPSAKLENTSMKSLQVENLGKSIGNISTHSSNSVRIRLKDETPPPESRNKEVLVPPPISPDTTTPNNDDIDLNLDLTEAEHYALYTAMAPHATVSEFDEMSCYYAQVEGGKLTNKEVILFSKS